MPSVSPTPTPLQQAQRARLVRSTRKLESILGETPLPAESIAFPQSVPESESTSSILPPSPKVSRRSSRPVLTVRLPSLSCIIAAPHSPLTPSSGISFNSSAAWASTEDLADNVDLVRRRKMAAKLSRTLGENIPPELVRSSLGDGPTVRRPRRVGSVTSSIVSSVRSAMSLRSTWGQWDGREESKSDSSLSLARCSGETQTCLIPKPT
ncbi:hypothetical protein DFH06DRAFT_1472128 [Mycena polygramma]|nr:hypothetical protein DFH06DRAFT_1475790 [Mycena polygramma]KAJ7660852.1 hypothetical protein DFH06DRAFT_1472128 [Mycena polygramma]